MPAIAVAMIPRHARAMENGDWEWVPHPPTMRQRIIAGVFVVALLVAGISSYAGWRLFGDYDKQVAGGITIVGLILFGRFMPTVRRR